MSFAGARGNGKQSIGKKLILTINQLNISRPSLQLILLVVEHAFLSNWHL
jgi:hypothetical protein